jgi:Iap family predicted aminopeptidase
LPIGGSDAISLARAGIPTVTIAGISTRKHDFTYHTRHDVPENIEPRALECIRDVLLDFVKKWDVAGPIKPAARQK